MRAGDAPRPISRAALGAALLALCASVARAQADVAICAAASTSSTDCRFTDVQTKLIASGLFGAVDVINANSSTPTLQQLQAYDVVLVWSNFDFQDSITLGDNLADYVDAGGAVVIAVFAVSDLSANRSVQGRWQSGYEVLADQVGSSTGAAGLGAVPLPSHPIMAGVASFHGGTSSFRPTTTTLTPGSIAIANWSDGRVLVAQGLNPKRIDLGFYPPSSDCASSFWNSTTDGARLLANALHFAAGVSNCGVTSYCTGSTTTLGCAPTMSSTGTPSVAASSGFTLECDGLEGQRQGLIFYGVNGRDALSWAPGSTSFLCVKLPSQRTPPQSSGGTLGQCDGTVSVDLLSFLASNPAALGQPISAGQTFNVQTWFRDAPAPKTTNTSDALEVTLCP